MRFSVSCSLDSVRPARMRSLGEENEIAYAASAPRLLGVTPVIKTVIFGGVC